MSRTMQLMLRYVLYIKLMYRNVKRKREGIIFVGIALPNIYICRIMEKTGPTSPSETLCVIFNKGYEQDKILNCHRLCTPSSKIF